MQNRQIHSQKNDSEDDLNYLALLWILIDDWVMKLCPQKEDSDKDLLVQ